MRFRPRLVRALLLGGGILTTFAGVGPAQDDRPPNPQVPTFRAGVNAVLVDVVVIDKDGQPVSGLSREDFQIFEDGVLQTVATFDVTDWTSYVGERIDGASSGDGVNAYPRRFILILNRQGSEFEYLNRAKRDLGAFIVESMAEGDEAMVIDVGYSLKVVQNFQAGKEQTLQAVRKLSQMRIDYPMGADRAAQQLYRDLESLGQALLGIPGRKIVILFSNELATFAPPGSDWLDNSFSLKKAVESLNQANTSVYTLDIRGAESVNSIQGGLSPLATETGGRYFRNNPSFGPPLRRIGAENQRYYLLSYVSTNAEVDGSYREIEVKVAREGATVIARPGYFAREPAAVTTDAKEKPAAAPKAAVTAELPLAVELSTYLVPTGRGAVQVPVSVALPADLLTGDGEAGRTLKVVVTDGNGKTVQTFDEPVSLERFYVVSSLSLEPGAYVLEVIVSAGARELHRASTGIQIPPGLGDRFGLSSILPVVSRDAAGSLGASDLPLLPVSAARRGDSLHVLFQILPGRETPSKRARVSYRILDAEGSEVLKDRVKDEIALSERLDGTPVILSLPTRSLAYGTYRVEVRIEDPSSGRAATSEIEFRVR
jgi:Ca-activated chloride channel family protein